MDMTPNAIPGRDAGQSAHWNGAAGRAWVDGQTLMDRVLQPYEDRLVEAVPPGFEGSVLDVGCGTGSTTLACARRVGREGRVAGVDISEPMLALARERAAREGSRAAFIAADAETYGFEPASVDLVLSRFGVMFFADPVAAFTNLRRAARAGGALRFIAWRSAAENPFMTTAERAAAPLLPALPPRPAGGPGQFALADGARLRAILADSGWTGVDVRALDVPCVMPEAQLVPYLSRLGPVGMALQGADDATRERVLAAVRPAFDSFVHGDEVRFTGACWLATASVTSPTP